jgi:AhpD family alkylhydroperoxidase
MKKPLVTPADESGDDALQELITFYEETLGFCPNSIKTMYHRPRIAYAFIEMNKAVMENQGRVSSALKRLIGYLCSHTAGCEYCEAHTIRAAERYGASNEQLEHIWSYRTHPAFSEAERAALDLAVAAAQIPNGVTDAVAERARQYWTEGEIVEMMGVIALFGYLKRWNDSMGTEAETGAHESGRKWLKPTDWSGEKHRY